jgi:hypothetical protein
MDGSLKTAFHASFERYVPPAMRPKSQSSTQNDSSASCAVHKPPTRDPAALADTLLLDFLGQIDNDHDGLLLTQDEIDRTYYFKEGYKDEIKEWRDRRTEKGRALTVSKINSAALSVSIERPGLAKTEDRKAFFLETSGEAQKTLAELASSLAREGCENDDLSCVKNKFTPLLEILGALGAPKTEKLNPLEFDTHQSLLHPPR